MTARAKRRDDARTAAKVMEKSGAAELDTIAELAATRRDLELARGWLKTYKDREQRLAMIFQFVSNAIIKDDMKAAQIAMRSAAANDLKDAREVMAAREKALALAVEVLERHDRTGDIFDALVMIRTLGQVAMTAEKVAHG